MDRFDVAACCALEMFRRAARVCLVVARRLPAVGVSLSLATASGNRRQTLSGGRECSADSAQPYPFQCPASLISRDFRGVTPGYRG